MSDPSAAPRARLLLVEDDADLARGLSFNLGCEGYAVEVARGAAAAAASAQAERFDLVLLDLALPDGDGLELLERWRRLGAAWPVICLTARSQESDVVAGLRRGADDYVTKPFGLAELLARIESVLRRTKAPAAGADRETVVLGEVEVDLASRRVARPARGGRAGAGGELTPIETELLRYLLARRGRVLDRAQMLKDLWGVEGRHATRTLDNHVARLRRKIELDPARPRYLVTVHGTGYRLERDAPP